MKPARTNLIGKGSVVNTPPAEDLRRSRRIGRRPALYSPSLEDQLFKKKVIRTNNNSLSSPELVTQSRRDHLHTSVATVVEPAAHEHPPEVAANVEPVATTYPEESKPDVNILWMLQPACKPRSRNEIAPENLAKFLEVASLLKSHLVSLLTSSTRKMSILDMIKYANACFTTLATLGDDYKSFHSRICKLIEYYQVLEIADKEREKLASSELNTRLYKQKDVLTDVTEKLLAAQNNLMGAVTRRDALRSKIFRLIDECTAEEEKVGILTDKRDECQEKHSSVEAEVHILEKEVGVALQGLNVKFDAAKEGVENMKNHLLHLLRKQ